MKARAMTLDLLCATPLYLSPLLCALIDDLRRYFSEASGLMEEGWLTNEQN